MEPNYCETPCSSIKQLDPLILDGYCPGCQARINPLHHDVFENEAGDFEWAAGGEGEAGEPQVLIQPSDSESPK